MSKEEQFIGVSDIAKYLGLSNSAVYKLCKNSNNNKFPIKKVGGKWMSKKSLIDKYFGE